MQTAARLDSHARWRIDSITGRCSGHKTRFVGTLKIRVFTSAASRPMPPALSHMLFYTCLPLCSDIPLRGIPQISNCSWHTNASQISGEFHDASATHNRAACCCSFVQDNRSAQLTAPATHAASCSMRLLHTVNMIGLVQIVGSSGTAQNSRPFEAHDARNTKWPSSPRRAKSINTYSHSASVNSRKAAAAFVCRAWHSTALVRPADRGMQLEDTSMAND